MRFPLLALAVIGALTAAAHGAKPNIVYINIDDLGVMDLGYAGSKYYDTPHIDKLASQGMVFTNGYAPSANCAPSRAACMSGLYAPRTGVLTVGSPARGNAATRKLIPIENKVHLDEKFVTIAEALKTAGYTTAQMGKWHLGKDPKTQGFDVNVAGNTRGGPPSYFSPYKNPDLPDGPKGEHLPARLTDEAIKWIKQVKGKPFFLYLPYYSIHTPIQGRKDLIEKYKAKKPGPGQSHATYAAMVDAMDQHVGRLLAALDELKLADNTIVIFTSDNGGICALSSQQPFRAGKGSYYEGGIREPFIIRWPAKVKAGTNDTPVSGIDFYPTLLEATGAKKPADTPLDGLSLMPLLTGSGELKPRALFWHFPIYLQAYNTGKDNGRDPLFRTRPGSVVRQGDWKLHEYFEDGGLELYNLKEDVGERNNLAAKMPDKAKDLHALLKQWRQDIGARVPTEKNPKYDPAKDKVGAGGGKKKKGKKKKKDQ